MEFSGVAVSGRERVHISTVLDGRELGLYRCGTCGAKVAYLDAKNSQCTDCHLKFNRVDRAVLL